MATAFRTLFAGLVFALIAPTVQAAPPEYSRTEDVVYGRRDGLALTMDVFAPAKPNGAGVIVYVSAGYRSDRKLLAVFASGSTAFLERGYTVFAVLLSSQPRYTVPEIVDDAHRAVRFVRHHAKKYGIDPEKVGVTGASAGGHLSLMMGCAGKPGNPDAGDPVDRQSSKAAAVACFCPPTDFLALEGACTPDLAALFDFREIDPVTGKFVVVPLKRRREIGREISPLTHASRGSAPVYIVHGDKDTLVPLSQSEALRGRLQACRVPCELIVKPGNGHVWLGMDKDVPPMVDWFDRHLLGRSQARLPGLANEKSFDNALWERRKTRTHHAFPDDPHG